MFNEGDLVVKEKYFIYKGNAYSLDSDITTSKSSYLINQDTNEEYAMYTCNSNDIPENVLLKKVMKYDVRKGFTIIETFDTEEEAKYFIDLITNTKVAE